MEIKHEYLVKLGGMLHYIRIGISGKLGLYMSPINKKEYLKNEVLKDFRKADYDEIGRFIAIVQTLINKESETYDFARLPFYEYNYVDNGQSVIHRTLFVAPKTKINEIKDLYAHSEVMDLNGLYMALSGIQALVIIENSINGYKLYDSNNGINIGLINFNAEFKEIILGLLDLRLKDFTLSMGDAMQRVIGNLEDKKYQKIMEKDQ